jgi:hypothetical protein
MNISQIMQTRVVSSFEIYQFVALLKSKSATVSPAPNNENIVSPVGHYGLIVNNNRDSDAPRLHFRIPVTTIA